MIADTKYVKEILTDYDLLSVRCSEFDLSKHNKDAQEVILSLKNTLRANSKLVALSANQVGYATRIICLNFNGDIRTFVNPIITRASGFELSREYCSSIPDKSFLVTRNSTIEITYQTPMGKIQSVELVGLAARIMQHHMQHLDGILVSDIGLEVDEEFDNASAEEQQQVIEMYLDSLDMLKTDIEKSIDADEDTQKVLDAVKFMESVRKGETVIEQIELTPEEIEQLKAVSDESNS